MLSYDNEGRLTAWQNAPTTPASSDSFLYDGEGNRVAQQATTNGSIITSTVYVAGGLEEITSTGASTTLTKYFAAQGLPTAERVGTNGPLSYLATDGQGTVSESLDGSGNVTSAQLYTPYGNVRYSSGSSPTSLGYTGQRADSATGLDYYHARYYDPAAGQFTSADTVDDGLNRYGYVAGNPTTNTDPSGHRLWDGSSGAGGGIYLPGPRDCHMTNTCPTGSSGGGSTIQSCPSGKPCVCPAAGCQPTPQPAPCANQKDKCSNPPDTAARQQTPRIQNARNDARQGLGWLYDLLTKVEGARSWFQGDWGNAIGWLTALVPGLDDLIALTQQLIALFQTQLSWDDAMWTAGNIANIQNQAHEISGLLLVKALGISSALAVASALPLIGGDFMPAAIDYWASVEIGVTADLAASDATIAHEQWSLLGF